MAAAAVSSGLSGVPAAGPPPVVAEWLARLCRAFAAWPTTAPAERTRYSTSSRRHWAVYLAPSTQAHKHTAKAPTTRQPPNMPAHTGLHKRDVQMTSKVGSTTCHTVQDSRQPLVTAGHQQWLVRVMEPVLLDEQRQGQHGFSAHVRRWRTLTHPQQERQQRPGRGA